MNRLRKNSIVSNAKRSPIAIMVDANCACPFDYFSNDPDFKVLAQPAHYLKHDIVDTRDRQALELFYMTSDSEYWQSAHLIAFDENELQAQVHQQLQQKSAMLLLIGDAKLLPNNHSASALLNKTINSQSIETLQKSSLVSQVLQCHSVFAGQAALYHALMETLPQLLEGKESYEYSSHLRDSLAVMQTLKSQVRMLNGHLATWFVMGDKVNTWKLNVEVTENELKSEKLSSSMVDKWFRNRAVYFYHHQKMHQECKKRGVRASIEHVVVQLMARTPDVKKYPDVFFSYAGELSHIEDKSWWQQAVKSLYDAGFMPHLTQAPLAQALSMGSRSLSIALIES
jgi:hypothetical protein